MVDQSVLKSSPFDRQFIQKLVDLDESVLYFTILACQILVNGEKAAETLGNLPFWKDIETILDVGCGPGDVASYLLQNSVLNGKEYTGIDIKKSFIDSAIAKNLGKNFKFHHENVFDFKENGFDAILMIGSLQHIRDVDRVMPKLSELIKKNGYFLFFDAMPDSPAKFEPDVPIIRELYNSLTHKNTSGSRNDLCLIQIGEKTDHFGLKIIESGELKRSIPSFSREDCARYILLTAEFVKRMYSVQIDQEELLKQLIFWHSQGGNMTFSGFGKLIAQKI